jgi:hypothetical protein
VRPLTTVGVPVYVLSEIMAAGVASPGRQHQADLILIRLISAGVPRVEKLGKRPQFSLNPVKFLGLFLKGSDSQFNSAV